MSVGLDAHPPPRAFCAGSGTDVRIEHVKSHTGVRGGNEAADILAALGAGIEDGHRMIKRYSAEPTPQPEEHKDNG